jgi:hypothetical protein
MFLYSKEQALSPDLCKAFIKNFEESDEKAPGVLDSPNGYSSNSFKVSTDMTFHPGYLKNNTWGPLLSELIPIVEKGQQDYISRYYQAFSTLANFQLSSHFNIQRYNPGEGFSGWHCERAGKGYLNRILVWMIYLNTVTDRGETEFFYQHHFERPVEGKLIMWPSDWTYLHRGVVSETQTKYILTGWFTHIAEE